ncbi:MAG: EAL domain-containing protein [Cellulosilyticaceae bacterium]
MRLSTKTTLIFLLTMLISGVAYVLTGTYLAGYLYKGETTRITGITGSVMSRVDSEVVKLTGKTKDYASLIGAARRIQSQFGVDGFKALQLESPFKQDEIDFKLFLTPEFEVQQIYGELGQYEQEELEKILAQVQPMINPSEPGVINRMIGTISDPYFVGVVPLFFEDYKVDGYFVLVEHFGQTKISEIGARMMRELNLVTTYDKDSAQVQELREGVNVAIVYDAETVRSYYQLSCTGVGQPYYIELVEPLVIWLLTKGNIDIVIGLVTVFSLLIFLGLWRVMDQVVVQRLRYMTDAINCMRESSDLTVRLEKGTAKDEIAELAEGINNMVEALEESHSLLVANEQKYSQLAKYDSLTGLYNRYRITYLMEEIKMPYTVYFVDIDNFKEINDAMGHNIGDEVICEVAKQLKSFIDRHTKVARIGGDEFVILRLGSFSEEAREAFAKSLLGSINRVYSFGNYTFEINGSMGISYYPEHAVQQKNLLRYADIAMYHAKQHGGRIYSVFRAEMLEEIELEAELREAITKDEFNVFYQPIYDMQAARIMGAEALVRWEKNGELISPIKFIPLAKKTGDIALIDQIVLEQACQFCKRQRELGKVNFEVSVNASYRWLMQADVMQYIDYALDEAGLPPQALKLEITEDEVMDNPKQVIALLMQIKAKGIRIALDDFGVGYSSFNYIKMLPIDVLKIDRSLLLEVEQDNKTKSIIETMIMLSHTLGLEVVCEGVETSEQMNLLQTIGCDKIQGYLISKPVPEQAFLLLENK